MTRISFGSDVRTQHACIRNLEVIGEAVKHIPDEVRSMAPEIEWKKIAGLRDIIWDVIDSNIPKLQPHIISLRRKIASENSAE